MKNNPDWQQIAMAIERAINQPFSITKKQAVSGGCINSVFILEGNGKSFFIKLNQAKLLPMFEAEFAGLEEISRCKTIRVPLPILSGLSVETAFLVVEKVSFISGNHHTDTLFGQQLAALHQLRQPFYGWSRNNTIGSTEQVNDASDDWVTFFRQNRLLFQLSLAEKQGYGRQLIKSGEKLATVLNQFFSDYTPQPALLHGDLWTGNAAVTSDGDPIIYDPACYYGDREADMAMTELFGSFGSNFYAAYNEYLALDEGYSTRKTLYNLYHILNHLNLFGESYQHQAQQMIDWLLSEIS